MDFIQRKALNLICKITKMFQYALIINSGCMRFVRFFFCFDHDVVVVGLLYRHISTFD